MLAGEDPASPARVVGLLVLGVEAVETLGLRRAAQIVVASTSAARGRAIALGVGGLEVRWSVIGSMGGVLRRGEPVRSA
jgi:hypothetical protein